MEKVLSWRRQHLTANGSVYISFPPWFSPFAGHQAGWPLIRYIPWYHLLPSGIKKLLAPRRADRYMQFAQELDHLTIRSLEQIIARLELTIQRRELFHLRPEYRWRYRVPVIKVSSLLARLPRLSEVTSSGAYYLLAPGPFANHG